MSACWRAHPRHWPGTLYAEASAAATVSAASLLATGIVGFGLRTMGTEALIRCPTWRAAVRAESRDTRGRRTSAAAPEDVRAAAGPGARGGGRGRRPAAATLGGTTASASTTR